jgi:hypothetical protein
MGVVLEEAVYLPGRQKVPDAVSECFRRYVSERDAPPTVAVSAAAICECVMPSGPVRVYVAPSWPASVSATAATAAMSRTSTVLTCGIADRGIERALSRYRPGEREQALEKQVRPHERESDAEIADVPPR